MEPPPSKPPSPSTETVEAHFTLAGVLHNAGKLGDAEASYRKVLELSPGHIPAKLGLDGALIGTGRPLDVPVPSPWRAPDSQQSGG
jgi:hypothetical protein